jgi:hypothetical protein
MCKGFIVPATKSARHQSSSTMTTASALGAAGEYLCPSLARTLLVGSLRLLRTLLLVLSIFVNCLGLVFGALTFLSMAIRITLFGLTAAITNKENSFRAMGRNTAAREGTRSRYSYRSYNQSGPL